MSQFSAIMYFAMCLGTVVFQICVIAGAPWGRLTQGGFHEKELPAPNRIAAGFSSVLVLAMGLSILSAAGYWSNWSIWTGWTTLAVTVLSVVMNLITPSRAERLLWGPITVAMLALACVVMLS